MNVNLKKESWHYKIYAAVIDDNPPKSLCPYFWSLVAIFVFSPLILFVFSIMWIDKKIKHLWSLIYKPKPKPQKSWEILVKENEVKRIKREKIRKIKDNVSNGVRFVSVYYLVPILLVLFILLIYTVGDKMGWLEFFMTVGLAIGIVAVVALILLGVAYLLEKYSNKLTNMLVGVIDYINPFKWGIFQIVGGMIYATYKKSCPIINWEDNIETKKETENVYD
jgi:hypothetical protein